MALDKRVIDLAREVTPEPFLRSIYGNDVKVTGGGRSISVSKVLRADKNRSSGEWVACDWQGGGIGDNIKLLNYVSGLDFGSAIVSLTGQTPFIDREVEPPPMAVCRRRRQYQGSEPAPSLHVPKFIDDFSQAREYLIGRGITPETIDEARGQGRLRATENSVCFIGTDKYGTLRYVAHRYYEKQPVPDSPGEFRNKKDEVGSSKVHCFWLPPPFPDMPKTGWIVEGGVNALALSDILSRESSEFHSGGPQNPLILTTGGVAMRDWMANVETSTILRDCVSVTMVGENEHAATPEAAEKKQADTDRLRHVVLDALKERHGIAADLVFPPKWAEDTADMQERWSNTVQQEKKRIKDEKIINAKIVVLPPRSVGVSRYNFVAPALTRNRSQEPTP